MYHTWRRADGTYYDSAEAEREDDEPLPLRPSEIHEWTGRRWTWTGKTISHSTPRDDDCSPISPERMRDVLSLLHETIAVQDYQGRTLEALRVDNARVNAEMSEHLRDAKPLMEALSDLQKLARISSLVGRVLVRLWRVMVWSVAIGGALWALLHGDVSALKRALSVMAS
jgi:hypothetical protein